MNTMIIDIMEVIGTIAFAVSGALVAISYRLDLFGVIFLGCITAVGGGIVRDIMMGQFPPAIFSNVPMLSLAAVTALVVFIIAYINAKQFTRMCEKIEPINNVFDAIGLATFTVMGAEAACGAGYGDKACFVIIMGMLTGVGGGIFRDVFVSKSPYILNKHIYALASIGGGISYYCIRLYGNNTILASTISILFILAIRMLATKYEWKLPKINI